MQQRLPLAVLKLNSKFTFISLSIDVATALTACGIETFRVSMFKQRPAHELQQRLPLAVLKQTKVTGEYSTTRELQQRLPLAVLKRKPDVKGASRCWLQQRLPLAVLKPIFLHLTLKFHTLQQRLPLAVLKHIISSSNINIILTLQQHLPLAVLKRYHRLHRIDFAIMVATALTVYGIETISRSRI